MTRAGNGITSYSGRAIPLFLARFKAGVNLLRIESGHNANRAYSGNKEAKARRVLYLRPIATVLACCDGRR